MNIKATVKYGLALAAVLVLAGNLNLGFGRSSTKSYQVTLGKAAKLNGVVLEPGDYTIKIPENAQPPKVEFYKGDKLVATAQAQVQSQPQKNDATEIEMVLDENTYVVTSIAPRGSSEKFVLGESGSETGF